MTKYRLSIQRLAYFLVSIFLLFHFITLAQFILAPLAFATLIAFMLKPLSDAIERFVYDRPTAILLSFLIAVLPVVLLLTFFSLQLMNVVAGMPQVGERLIAGVYDLVSWGGRLFGLGQSETEELMKENVSAVLETPVSFITSGLSSSTFLITSILLCIIYVFFLLLYRTSIKNFVFAQFAPRMRLEVKEFVEDVQKVAKKYLYGLGMVVLILGMLNSIGLLIIGIEYSFFWGFLAACLAIIPYIGTTLGGILPFLYALATTDTTWQPAAVVILYVSVQLLEGNFITPKVVGSSVKVNPFAAILSLIIGGALWGVAGLILALPFVAILKVSLQHFDVGKPISALLSDDLYKNRNIFLEQYDDSKYRIINYFRRKEETERYAEKKDKIIPSDQKK